ncbi:hypothetical protein [Kocuria varians]|uniref:hypothetical protein n=1 Tax=Kocuria varians TaxID=1272 RepID=UPI0008398E49|nr:hypothetical protein [Kocuria varians]
MPSSAHDPAGEPREPHGEETEGVPAAGQDGHGTTSQDAPTIQNAPTTHDGIAAQDAPTSRAGAVPAEDGAHTEHGTAAAPGAAGTTGAAGTAGAAAPNGQQPYTYAPPAALASMTPRHWWVPAVAGAAGYVGTVVGTVVAMLLTLLGALISGDSNGSLTEQLDDQIDDYTGTAPDLSGVSWFLSIPFQLAAMAALVPLRLSASFAGEGGNAGITVPQYFALVCGILAAWFVARALTKDVSVQTRAVQWVMAAVGGAVWGALALIVTAVTALRLDVPVFYSTVQLRISAVGVGLFVVLFLVGLLTVASALNVRSTQAAPGRLVIGAERSMPGVLQVLRPMVVQFCVFGAVAGLGLLIWAFVKGGAVAGFSAPFWLPIAVGWLFVLSLLSALTAGGAAATYTDLAGSSHAAYLWSEGAVPAWVVVLCILLALVSVVCAAVAWAHVRPVNQRIARNPVAWAVLPVAYFVLGLLAMWLLNVSGYASATSGSSQSAGFSLRPAGWTCLVFLLWGAVIELLARFVAPAFMGSLPAVVTRWLRGSERARGRAAVVASAAAMGGAVVAAAPAAASAAPAAASSAPSYPAAETARTEPVSAQRAYDGAAAPGEQTRVLPTYGDAQAAAEPQPREPMDPQKKKRIRLIAIIAGAVILLVVAAIIVFSVLSRTVFGPDNQAEELLQSVTDGKAKAVSEVADPNVSTGQRGLLTDEVYGAAENRVSSYEIKDTQIDGDHATVNATVTQDGVTTPVALPMVSDSRNGLFKSWRVDSTAGSELYQSFSVRIPGGVSELTVNGTKVPVDSQSDSHEEEFTVLPGDYDVSIASSGKYVTYGGDQVAQIRAGSQGSAPSMSFSASFTPVLKEDLTKQLNAKLDTCAKSTSFEPEGCPFSYSIFGDKKDYRNPSWSLERYPTYSVSSYGDHTTYSTDKSGEVRLDYQYNTEYDDDEPAKWKDKDTTSSIYGSGTVTVSGDKITVNSED